MKPVFVPLTLLASLVSCATSSKPVALEGGALSATTQPGAATNVAFVTSKDGTCVGNGEVPENLERISVPTLVLDGEKSLEFMRPSADRLAKDIPHAERKTLAGQTHQLAPAAVTPLLIEFFGAGS